MDDLFGNDNPRLQLKPVRAYNDYLRSAFGSGPCQCIRCQGSGGNEAGYEHPHTFQIGVKTVNRRFAATSYSDVMGALSEAWCSYFKVKTMSSSGTVCLERIEEFTDPDALCYLAPLLRASGCAKENEAGELVYLPAPRD